MKAITRNLSLLFFQQQQDLGHLDDATTTILFPHSFDVTSQLDMKELLRSIDVFQMIDESNDVIAFLKLIHASTVIYQRSQRPALSALQALNKFTSFRQMNLTNAIYLEGFLHRLNIYEEITGEMFGSDVKRVEEECDGCIANGNPSDPNLVAARRNVEINFSRLPSLNMLTKKVIPICKST
jgi:hypothetical protein